MQTCEPLFMYDNVVENGFVDVYISKETGEYWTGACWPARYITNAKYRIKVTMKKAA